MTDSNRADLMRAVVFSVRELHLVEAVSQELTDRSGLSDEELLVAYRSEHDQEAVSELVRRYERLLFSYLARYTGDPGSAEELFQTTFLRVVEHCDQFTVGRKFRPWLYSIATHLAIDAGRRAGRQRSLTPHGGDRDDDSHGSTALDLLVDREPLPLDRLEADERRRIISTAVAKLPDDLRHLVILVYYQGLTLREVAEALEIPLGTVKSRLHKALLTLHDYCYRITGTNAA
jgi:RNA polymerase sigma-70 factor (ECF subfamily)